MKNGKPFVDYEPESCAEIFSIISTRQIIALMFHDQMADYFNFLSLDGFKELHEYQYLDESNERRKLKKYYISHHNKLLEELRVDDPHVIPDDWLRYNRMDVSTQVRTQSIQSSFKKYQEWEEETKALYEKCAHKLEEMGHIADKAFVECMIQDVDKELKCLYKMILKMRAVNYDLSFVMDYQHGLKKKYKEKIHKIFEN